MKRNIILIFFIPLILYAQWDFGLTMGLDFKSTPSYHDYINLNYSRYGKKLPTYANAINFNVEVDYKYSANFQLGVELNYLIDSYNTQIAAVSFYEISYTFLRPSLLAYYIIEDNGYKIKLGGGVGPRFF